MREVILFGNGVDPAGELADCYLRFGVGFADGRKATDLEYGHDFEDGPDAAIPNLPDCGSRRLSSVCVPEVRLLIALTMLSPASLTHTNGWLRSFQPTTKRRMAATRAATLAKLSRRIAWRVMIAKNTSTRFIQLAEVEVKCRAARSHGCAARADRAQRQVGGGAGSAWI